MKISIKWSIFKLFGYLFNGFISDFKKQNLTKKENIPSHIFIGGGILFITFTLIQTTLFMIGGAYVGAFFVGHLIEAIQQKWFNGIPNNRDVRWTCNGTVIFLPALFLTQNYINDYWGYGIALVLFILAFAFHNSVRLFK